MPATTSGGDVQRATMTELRAAIEEVRNVQLNICDVYHKICDAERKHGRQTVYKAKHQKSNMCVIIVIIGNHQKSKHKERRIIINTIAFRHKSI